MAIEEQARRLFFLLLKLLMCANIKSPRPKKFLHQSESHTPTVFLTLRRVLLQLGKGLNDLVGKG
jgi:hypothetical protein